MFELKRKYEFHAARKLTSLEEKHPCSKLHGHTFSVKIKVAGNKITNEGWIMDFYHIDACFKNKVHKELDHKYLNEIEGLSNPTTEHIAMWIWNQLKNDLINLHSVSVSEGSSYGCTYFGEKNA